MRRKKRLILLWLRFCSFFGAWKIVWILFRLQSPHDSYWTENNVQIFKADGRPYAEAGASLEAFRRWIDNRPASLPHSDHWMLFTGSVYDYLTPHLKMGRMHTRPFSHCLFVFCFLFFQGELPSFFLFFFFFFFFLILGFQQIQAALSSFFCFTNE